MSSPEASTPMTAALLHHPAAAGSAGFLRHGTWLEEELQGVELTGILPAKIDNGMGFS